MIEVRELTKVYPGVVAVDRISFDVAKGEIVGFLGPNGSGKTTTMRVLTGFLAPTSGSARIAGFDVVRESLQVRRRIGYLPESNPLYTEMRVREYLRYRATLKGVPRRDRKARVDEAILACSLQDVETRIIGQLSKGFRQRVGLADAIVHRPEIVILDEPTIGLDPNQVQEVRQLIRKLGEERTVVLSTHILTEVEVMCRRLVVISAGRIVAKGSVDEIGRELGLADRYRLVVRGDGRSVLAELNALDGVGRVHWSDRKPESEFVIQAKPQRDLRAALYELARQRQWNVLEIAQSRPSLEEVFALVTARKGDAA